MKRLSIFGSLAMCLFLGMFLLDAKAPPSNPPPPEIRCKHFIYGYPLGTPESNDLLIRDSYAMSTNDETKFADWVCYRLTPHETIISMTFLLYQANISTYSYMRQGDFSTG